MNIDEAFELKKQQFIGDDLIMTTVEEANAFHSKFIKLRSELFKDRIMEIMPHYRGEQNSGWDIRPGIFRPPLKINNPKTGKQLEEKAIQEFETVIKEKVGQNVLREIYNIEKYGKEWNLLFQAQHAGVKTTLTDWSAEIISALYFATEESLNESIENSDGQLWCFIIPVNYILGHNGYPQKDTFYNLNPFDMKGTYLINSAFYITDIENRIFEYRMYRQKGRFLISSNDTCHIPINKQEELKKFIFQIRIPAEFKKTIRKELTLQGITRAYMFIEEKTEKQDLITEINKTVFKGY